MDDVDGRVGEQLVERGVGLRDAEGLGAGRAALGGAAEDAANLDPDAAKRLDVDGADEARPDHRGADARDPARHARLTW